MCLYRYSRFALRTVGMFVIDARSNARAACQGNTDTGATISLYSGIHICLRGFLRYDRASAARHHPASSFDRSDEVFTVNSH